MWKLLLFPWLALAAAGNQTPESFLPDLSSMKLISCDKAEIKDQVITARPLESGAIMIPLNKADLTRYDRIKIAITPLEANFQERSFAVALRDDSKYFFARLVNKLTAGKQNSLEMTLDITAVPRKSIDFIRIYFNRDGKINNSVKFKLEKVELYGNTMISKLPMEKYQRKLPETLIFPRVQVKYSLFMNYLSAAQRDIWIERPLFFNRQLAADTKEYKKEGNLANFRKTAETAQEYVDGFSILACNKGYLARTLATMRYADKLKLKNFLMLEIAPGIVQGPGGMLAVKGIDFIYELVKAFLASPAGFKIDGKLVVSSYQADMFKPFQWKPIIENIKEQAGEDILFIAEVRKIFYKANNTYRRNGGKISLDEIEGMKREIRSYLDVADGLLFAGSNHIVKDDQKISSRAFGNEFYKDILIPTLISVFNEPEYKSKYLGLSAAKGYFYKRHAAGGMNEEGTLTLRQNLETAIGAKPDFIIMPEWNEVNENTHIEPTIYDSFTNRRIINHYRGKTSGEGDERDLPDLIISYRSELIYNEILTIELLNLPDSSYPEDETKIELRLKNKSGKILKSFAPFTLSNRKMSVKYLKTPAADFTDERVLIPELSLVHNGKSRQIKGLSCIMLKTPPSMNKKFVKQPIRDICAPKQADFKWNSKNGCVEAEGVFESEFPLNTIELLENDIPVAALDLKDEYKCAPGETLLRFCWNTSSKSTKLVKCSITPLSGAVSICNTKNIVLSEVESGEFVKEEKTINKNLGFATYINEFFFKASENSQLELSAGAQKARCSVPDLMKFGSWRKVFDNGDTIAVERVWRLPQVPYPLERKKVDFALKAKSIFPNPVYTLRATTLSGKIFRSTPYYPEKLSGKKIDASLWSYPEQKVVSLNIPVEYCLDVDYDFNPVTGNILPTLQPYRYLYAIAGGFNTWSHAFNKPGTISAPKWKKVGDDPVLDFDGIGNYLVFPAPLISEESFTVSFSLMPTVKSKQVIFQTYCAGKPDLQLLMENGILTGYFLNRQGKKFTFKTNAQLDIGSWNKVEIRYDMRNILIKINGGKTEPFKTQGILLRQPCLVFGGSYPPKGTHRFKGCLRAFSYANYDRSEF